MTLAFARFDREGICFFGLCLLSGDVLIEGNGTPLYTNTALSY